MPFWKPTAIWKDETVVIVGGGRSLLNFDWSVIKKYKVLVCNSAFLKMPDGIADAVLVCDLSALQNFRKDLEGFPGIVFLNLPEQKKWTERNCPSWAYSVERHYGGGLSDDGLCWNGNAGAGAINLALLCGAKRVYLLGFDMKADDQKNPDWYRENDQWDKDNPAIQERFDNWLKMFPLIDRDRKAFFPNSEIINVNDNSALNTFPKISVADFTEISNRPEIEKKQIDLAKTSVWIQRSYLGFGDNCYMRPVLREMGKTQNVFLHTSTPEFFWDLEGVFPVLPGKGVDGINLRTQAKNRVKTEEAWYKIPPDAKMIGFPRYHIGSHVGKTPLQAFRTALRGFQGCLNNTFFPRSEWVDDAKRVCQEAGKELGHRIVLVKPPTIRKEWVASAREPLTEYVQLAIDLIRKHSKNAFIIFVGDVDGDAETFVEPRLVGADVEYVGGELSFSTLLGLMSMSQLMLSGVGMFLPIGIALGIPTFTIFGGAFPPEELVDDEMQPNKWGYVAPEPFCLCRNVRHDGCNKNIPVKRLKDEFNGFLKEHWK